MAQHPAFLLLLLSTIQFVCHGANNSSVFVDIFPFNLLLHLDSENVDSDSNYWKTEDLTTVSLAAKEYIDGNNLLELALGLSSNSTLKYGGSIFEASESKEERRGLLRSSIAIRQLQETTDVILEGRAEFLTSQSSLSLENSIPSGDTLTNIIVELFANGEKLFVKKVKEVANEEGASEWLTKLSGYNASRMTDSSLSVNDTARMNQSNQNNYVKSMDASHSSGLNIFIIVGAAGAAVSLILLVGGLCHAKRTYDNSNSEKKDQSLNFQVINQPKCSILKNSPQKSLPPPPIPTYDLNDEMSDDESNADFMLARAALNNVQSSIQARGGASIVSNGANTSYADDMSYAFSVDADSLAAGTKISGSGDAAIGAGGISAFRTEKGGVFQWNEDGTKMVYTPVAGSNDSDKVRVQNGFYYDEKRKKWVVAQKNVSFQHSDDVSSTLISPRKIKRTQTDDSGGTGLSEFSYDDVALDFANTSTLGTNSAPIYPQEEGVEVTADRSMVDDQTDSEFVSNTNMERFMMDDESTAFGSVLTRLDDTLDNILLPSSQTTVTAERTKSQMTCTIGSSAEPGIIAQVPQINDEKSCDVDTPRDEDIPFDERPKLYDKHAQRNVHTKSMLVLPQFRAIDEVSISEGSADSSQVLHDLDNLSKFMLERKISSKSSKRSSVSSGDKGNEVSHRKFSLLDRSSKI